MEDSRYRRQRLLVQLIQEIISKIKTMSIVSGQSRSDHILHMRMEATRFQSFVYFDSSFTITGRKIVPQELPLFGGFYEMNGNYYILSGQTNKNESDSVEVYRITKYTKDWNLVASCGLYGENTTVPFDAGSARMAAYGDYLMIRTSHEMYKSKKDGYNHQANVTIQVDTSAMKVTDSYTKVMNVSFGYVSHSFNQFIQMENGKIVRLIMEMHIRDLSFW